jgi:DNA-binding NtrC family response regulator
MKPRVLVADQEKMWRERVCSALVDAGYPVLPLDDYSQLPDGLATHPEIALLGFAVVGDHEVEIVKKAVESAPDTPIVVLSASQVIPPLLERELFRVGVTDVRSRSGDVHRVPDLVQEELDARRAQLEARSSYARFRAVGAN